MDNIGGLIVKKKPLIDTDFSHSAYFGSLEPEKIPDFYFVAAEPLEIMDQGNSFMCPAYSLAVVAEIQWRKLFEPAYCFAKMMQILGRYNSSGVDPDTALKAITDYGFLPKELAPFNLQSKGQEFVANPTNWDSKYDSFASLYKEKSYFKADGQQDVFDSIREAIWHTLLESQSTGNKKAKSGVVVGAYWKAGWLQSPGGIIQDNQNSSTPHMFCIIGQKPINGIMYLIGQLSSGEKVGDGGLFYFSREIANQFLFAYIFRYADAEDVKKQTWGCLQKLKNNSRRLIKKIVK